MTAERIKKKMVFDTFETLITKLKEIDHNKRIYIWGTGVYGDLLGQFLNRENISWYGYYDNYTTDTVQFLNNKAVNPGTHAEAEQDKVYVLSMRNFTPVKKQIENKGTDENNIFAIGTIEAFNAIEDSVINQEEFSKEIKKFQNIYKNQRCFVIGNGPSLQGEDLDQIHANHVPSFACNSIYKAYDKTLWRPDYYVITDVNGIVMIDDDIKYISDNCKYIFSRSNGRLREYLDRIHNIRLFRSVYSESEEQFSFSSDCSEHLYMGHTVTYAMLQLAVYMGFSEIFLLGIDHQYAVEYVNG